MNARADSSSPWSYLPSNPSSPPAFDASWLRDGLQSIIGSLAALDRLLSTEDLAATLAGAVGTPVWKIATAGAHWSWLAEGASSRWHPTARILRATAGMDPLIKQLCVDLEYFAGDSARPGESE